MLSKEELEHYSRQIRLDGFGESAQEKLKSAKVLVIGAGALGCPVLQYLTAAGIGKIGIVDGDKIERNNLHRQILYTENDLGKRKAEIAKTKLAALNSNIQITIFSTYLNSENAFEIANEYDIIIDGTDNFPTRYLVNDLCVLTDKVNIHGSIQQFSGQVSVFNAVLKDGGRSPNYRDLFPIPPNPNDVVSCAEGGVIGALPGIIGSTMTMECLKIITEIGEPLIGKLFQYNSLTHQSQLLNFTFDDENPLRGNPPKQTTLIDYQQFCGIKTNKEMKEVTVAELKSMKDNKEDFQLIDVREIHEFKEKNLDGELIPLGEIPQRFAEISKDKKVVIHCKMGGRSANAINYLQQTHGYDNLYNLRGGIIAWLMEIER
jgi:molybdopterin/thiamine biosynthesis adenylyltransferase/rhodanese-related sulfurtransferase